jgi:sugar lactone lactonase YvrE
VISLGDDRTFDFDASWEQLPAGMRHLDVAGVAIGASDTVFVSCRHDPRIIVYDRDGRFLRSFGEGILSDKPHGIAVANDGLVYCADTPANVIRVFDASGRYIRDIGDGVASDSGIDMDVADPFEKLATIRRAAPPFNGPAGVAIGLHGDLYVADGYGNAAIHHFDSDGTLIRTWGQPGSGPGQFHLPHGLCVLTDGTVIVADRENDRLQLFTGDGEFLAQWTDVVRPAGVAQGADGLVYVAELPWTIEERSFAHGVPQAQVPGGVSVFTSKGELVGRFRSEGDPCAPDRLAEPHGIAVDSEGNIFVGGVTFTGLGRRECHTLQRLARRST